MPTDKLELERRVALTSPDYLVRGFNFAAVLGLVEKHRGADAAHALRGPIGKRVLGFFNYPAADFIRIALHAADLLEAPLGSVDAAFGAMGEACANSLLATTVGKTLVNFVRGGNSPQILKHVNTAYAMSQTYGERVLTVLDERTARLEFRGDPVPAPFHQAVLVTGLAAVGVNVLVTAEARALDRVECTVQWM